MDRRVPTFQRLRAKLFAERFPSKCCIYRITCCETGECYIGGTVNLKKRVRQHLAYLQRKIHSSRLFQAAFDRHGLGSWSVDILEDCRMSELDARELYWFEKLRPKLCLVKPRNIQRETRKERKAARSKISDLILSGKVKGIKRREYSDPIAALARLCREVAA